MRRGICLLAFCGIVSLMTGGVSAQNPFQPPSSSPPAEAKTVPKRTVQYFSRSGGSSTQTVSPTGQSAPPTQYKRGTQAAPATATVQIRPAAPQNSQPKSASVNQQQTPAKAADSSNPFAPVSSTQVRTSQPKTAPTWNNSSTFGQKQPGQTVIQADYTHQQGTAESNMIRQVGATGDEGKAPVNPFAEPQPKAPAVANTNSVPKGNSGVQTPSISLEWVKKSSINIGQKCEFELVVKNTGEVLAKDVEVAAYFPNTVRLTSTDPKPTAVQNPVTWTFDEMKSDEEQRIAITLIPSRRGDLNTHATVRFTGAASGAFKVEEPLLKVAVKGPQEIMRGDPASQTVVISNPGTGIAQNVVVEAFISPGLEHPRGKRILMEIGSLNPNESRNVRLPLVAIEGGQQGVKVEATADGGLRQIAMARLDVSAPSIKVVIDGPGLRYKGRVANYTLTVTNDGAAASNNVRVMYKMPEGFKFLKADKNGKYNSTARMVNWFVGRLEPNQTATVKVSAHANVIGEHSHMAGAVSEDGARSESVTKTKVEGTASLVLEIVDLDDPVEVGTETAYEIRVRNDGTKAAQNVGISCELPNGMKLISAKGPADFIAENGLLVFKSLPQLQPGKAAVFRVHVEGVLDGNHRFRARLASDSIQEPLIFEELTKFYTDAN